MERLDHRVGVPAGHLHWYLLTVAAAITTILSGVNHDYSSYVQHWQLAMDGANPWATRHAGAPVDFNAYGPGNLVLAPLVAIHPLTPKLFLALAVFLVALVISMESTRQGTRGRDGRLSPAVLFALCPLTTVYVFGFGSNDALAALTVALAFHARQREKYAMVGMALALGALVKFYPILFVPLLALTGDGRVQLRAFASATAVFLLAMGAAFLVWGSDILAPFVYATERAPKMLSILRFLDPASAKLGGESLIDWLIEHNSIMVVAVASAFAAYAALARLDWRVAASTGILLILMTYKVGHPHFYLAWLAAYAWLGTQAAPELRRLYTRAFAPLAIFLSAFSLLVLVSGFTGEEWYLMGSWAKARPIGAAIFMVLALYGFWQARDVLVKSPTRGLALSW